MKELTQDYIQATEPSGIAPSYYLTSVIVITVG
jgi:hypothetical protein